MTKYPVNKDFRILSLFKASLGKAALPVCNAFLGAVFDSVKSDGEVRVCKKKFPSFDGEEIPSLLFEPRNIAEPSPCLLWFHGGAFCFKAGKYQYELAKKYASGAACKVLFVDYRLAPQFPFPIPFEDCFCALQWAADNAAALGVNPLRIAVGGDSAGGNLAAACVLASRDRNKRVPCGQMLLYPVTDKRMITSSMNKYVDTPVWNAVLNKKMWRFYLSEDNTDLSYASPAEAEDFSDLPDAYIETAEFDCLRDEGAEYADKLRGGGCRTVYADIQGAVHGFDVVLSSGIVKRRVLSRTAFLREIFDT